MMAHMFDHKAKLLEQLHSLPANLSVLSSTEVAPAMAVLRSVEGLVAGAIAAVATRAGELEAAGVGDPVIDVLQSGGKASARQARIQAARADVGKEFPLLGAALLAGQASAENVDSLNTLVRGMTEGEKAMFTAADAEIAHDAATMSPESFRRSSTLRIRNIRSAAGANVAAQNEAASYVKTGLSMAEGMQYFHAQFDPTRGAEIAKALDWKTRSIACRDGAKDEPLEISDNLAAQALYELIVDGVSYHDNRGSGRSGPSGSLAGGVHRIPSVSVLVDWRTLQTGPHPETICETWAGAPLPPDIVTRLCCDARISEVVIGPNGEPLNVGREHRSATDAQRKMLRAMYGGCAISGDSFDQCHVHHVQFWEKDGPTDLDNLVPISHHWHRLVHEGRWKLTMEADRTLVLRRPDESLYRVIGPPGPLQPSIGHARAGPARGASVPVESAQETVSEVRYSAVGECPPNEGTL